MPFRLSSLLLLFACAPYLPVAHGMERIGDAAHLYELEQYANAAATLETEFLSLIENASSEERFYLYWTYNHLPGPGSRLSRQTQLELSVVPNAQVRPGIQEMF